MTQENAELVTFGTGNNAVTFRGRQVTPSTFQQSYSGFRTGPGADRTALTDLTKAKISDFAGGLDPTPGIKSWLTDLNKFSYNEGLQTRHPGLCVLPYDVVNQTAVTSGESLASAVAAGWRVHGVATSLGDTETRVYFAVGHKIYRNVGNGDSSLEVAYTTTDVITAMRVLNVNGTPKLCVATYHASTTTDDTFYVADPTGTWSGNLTTLINMTAGDYITGMDYFPTIGPGVNIMVGTIGGTAGIWWQDVSTAAAWTMKQVVLSDTKNQSGSLATTTITNTDPTYGSNDGLGTKEAPDGNKGKGVWINTENVFSDDSSDASYTIPSSASHYVINTSYLVATGFDISSRPKGSLLKGVSFTVDHAVNDTAWANMTVHAQLLLDGVATGIPKSVSYTDSTTDATSTFGDANDTWGLGEVSDFTAVGVRVWFTGDGGSSGALTIYVDHIRMTNFKYQPLGDTISFPLGGWMVAPNPAFPSRMAIVTPATSNDIGAITVPRVMWFLDFSWEAGQERPVVTYSRPNTGLNYIHHAFPFQGGWAITGGSNYGPGTVVKHVDSSGNLRDFAFPAHNGNEPFAVSSLSSQGAWLILDCVATDNGDRQWWFYNNGRYFPDTLLQSLSDGLDIAAQPVPFSTPAINISDNIIYSIFPNSTSTAVARQFLPPDLGADPRLVNTSEVRTQATVSTTEDTTLKLRSVEMDLGPEEANKTLVQMEYLGRRISAATGASYGSVTVDIDTGGDTAFGTAEATKQFTSAFEVYDVPSAGIPYRTLLVRLGLNHDAGSAESPDGLPILLTTAQDWPHERTYTFLLEELVEPRDIFSFMDQLEALMNEQLTQPLDMSTYPTQIAKFDRYLMPEAGLLLPPRSVQPAPSHFTDPQGNPTMLGLQFHTLPGQGSS